MIAFWILAVLLISSAVFVVTATRPVHSVVALLANFVVLAAFYLTLSAEFLAVTQILVYSGAILILFVFVIALLSSGIRPVVLEADRLPGLPLPAFIAAITTLVAIGVAASHTPIAAITGAVVSAGTVGMENAFGSVKDFGATLFTTQLLPFEVTSLILIVAIVGVVMLIGEREGLIPPAASPPKKPLSQREPILRGGER